MGCANDLKKLLSTIIQILAFFFLEILPQGVDHNLLVRLRENLGVLDAHYFYFGPQMFL